MGRDQARRIHSRPDRRSRPRLRQKREARSARERKKFRARREREIRRECRDQRLNRASPRSAHSRADHHCRAMKFAALLLLYYLAASAAAQDIDATGAIKRCDPASVRGCVQPLAPSVVSTASPFAVDCNGYASPNHYHNAPVEPWVAIDPKNPRHFIGVWQQDRWADGASSALVAAASFDGGRTWNESWAHFSTCSGGSYARASDPWISFAPDGTAHQISLSVSQDLVVSAVLASKSSDGGLTWSDPVTLIQDGAGAFNDKESITADPYDSSYVYAVWDRSTGSNSTSRQPMWFARSTDGGDTWEKPRVAYDPGTNAGTTGN